MSRYEGIIPNTSPNTTRAVVESFHSIHSRPLLPPTPRDNSEKNEERKRKRKVTENLDEMDEMEEMDEIEEMEYAAQCLLILASKSDYTSSEGSQSDRIEHLEEMKRTEDAFQRLHILAFICDSASSVKECSQSDRIEHLEEMKSIEDTTPSLSLDAKRQLASSEKECSQSDEIEHLEEMKIVEDVAPSLNLDPKRKRCSRSSEQKKPKKREQMEIDDSEETLMIMLHWKNGIQNMNNVPRQMVGRDSEVLGRCSKPMWKQVMKSDVKKDQCRLMLGKEEVSKMMVEVLGKVENFGTEGRMVSVYGRDGKIFQMVFKMWNGNTPVLSSPEWKKFVNEYELKPHTHFLIIRMFKHLQTHQICFAIDFDKFSVNGKLSNRILKELASSNLN